MPLPPFRLRLFWLQLSFLPFGTGGISTCCATGSLHTGTPSGYEEERYGLNTYIAEPTRSGILLPKGVVVIIPDIFGWTLANNRILADEMAKKGPFVVLLPDLMGGYVVPPSLLTSFRAMESQGFIAFLKKMFHAIRMMYWLIPFSRRNSDDVVRARLHQFLEGVREAYPDMPVGTAGYCWGGKYTIELCTGAPAASSQEATESDAEKGLAAKAKPLVVCGFTAHPSRVNVPSDIEAVQLPLSIATATVHDPFMSTEQAAQVKQILEDKTKKAAENGVRLRHEFVRYEGARHGFAVRADVDDKEEAQRGRKAGFQAVRWLAKWFDVSRSSMQFD